MAKPGPRPKAAADKKSVHVGLRITPQLHQLLLAEAQKSERSLSHEIEYRLRRSFEQGDEDEQKFRERFGGPTSYWVLLITGNLIRRLERFTGERWWRDPYTHWQMRVLIKSVLDRFKPVGLPRTPRRFAAIGQPLGEHLAEHEFDNIEHTLVDPDPPIGWNWGGMTITEWRQAADVFKHKFTQSKLEGTKKK
jgi:hypothetical protein